MEAKNIDDTLVKLMANEPVEPTVNTPVESVQEVTPTPVEAVEQPADAPIQAEQPTNLVETGNKSVTEKSTDKPVTSDPIDEYGNPVEKSKTYTEEEVQRMIRDRLSRGRRAGTTASSKSTSAAA